MPKQITDLPLDCLDMIFRELSPNELASVSRTCTLLKNRILDYKQRFPDEYGKKMDEHRRCVEDAFNFEHDETDTEGDGNFLVDFDDDAEELFLGEDDDWPDQGESDLESFGSNLAYSDDDDEDWC